MISMVSHPWLRQHLGCAEVYSPRLRFKILDVLEVGEPLGFSGEKPDATSGGESPILVANLMEDGDVKMIVISWVVHDG